MGREMPHRKAHGVAHLIWKKTAALWARLFGNRVVRNGAIVGLLGAVFVPIFQSIVAYQNSAAQLAKDDLDNAVKTLAATVSELSDPLSLQERVIWEHYSLVQAKNPSAADLNGLHEIVKAYQGKFTTLSAHTPLLAREMEIYLDLPGDLNHANKRTGHATANNANLLNSDFECDSADHMPKFGMDKSGKKDLSMLALNFKGPALADNGQNVGPPIIDWKSAKDNLVTLEFCFEHTHYQIKDILQWANSEPADKSKMPNAYWIKQAISQGKRFDDFLNVATYKIEQFRVGYQPNGFLCNVPLANWLVDHAIYTCWPRPPTG